MLGFTRPNRGVGIVLGLLLCFGPAAQAQVANGSIAGQVFDPSGAAVPAVRLRLISLETAVERTAQADAAGSYTFPIVPPGTYTLRAEAPGFRSFEVSKLEIRVAQQVKQDIELTVGESTTKVEVTAVAPVLDARSAEVGQVIGTKEVTDIPLNGRNYFDLAKLAPGVAELPTSSQSTGLSINGQRANQIGFYFDGIDTRTESSGRPAFTPSLEAIQEFKVQENSFSAEYGRTTAAINLTLRPGGNDIHASLFEFLRNNDLDARSFFSPTVDPLRRNQFGVVVSGPIIRNKTFFMFNYEGLRTRRARTLYLSVPTADQRNGNFAGGPIIYDPATYNAATNTRQPFPGNLIPSGRFGPIATAALKYFPLPNTTGFSGFNYVTSTSNIADGDQYHGRFDHHFNDHDQLFGRYSYSQTNTVTPGGLPYTGSSEPVTTHSFTVQEVHTFTPNVLNELRTGFTYYNDVLGFPLTSGNLTSQFGLVNLSPAADASGVPQIAVPGLTTLGANAFQPNGPKENLYSLADDITWIHGKHSLKFGFDGRYFRPAQRVQQTPNGILTFARQFTTQPGVANTGSAIADFLLGDPNNIRATQLAESNGWVSLKYYYYAGYFQDELRLNPKLTLTLGLRYEYQTPYNERYNNLADYDYTQHRFLQLGKDIPALTKPDRNNFAPRFGLAYSATSKTVVRAGFGVFYGQPRGNEFGSLQLSPPYLLDTTLVSNALIPDLLGRSFPVPVVRNSSGGIAYTPSTNVFSLDYNFPTNYTYQWNFGIQQQLSGAWLLETAYVGNSSHKLTGRDLVNQAVLDPDPTRPTPLASRRPIPSIGDVSMVKAIDNTNYHALNVKLEKRFSRGLSILGAYTYSKAIGIGGSLSGDQSRQQSEYNRAAEYAALEYNQKHRLTVAWIYELPFGKGKSMAAHMNGLAEGALGGWSVQGIYTAHSGFPLTPNSSVSSNVGRQDLNRPNRTCDGNLASDQRSLTHWFETTCFPDHPFGTFGNSGNGVIIGPGVFNVDMTAMKNFHVPLYRHEPGTLQFRAEFFNAFNHASFADPNMNVGTPQFGVIRGTRIDGREIQLALKFLF